MHEESFMLVLGKVPDAGLQSAAEHRRPAAKHQTAQTHQRLFDLLSVFYLFIFFLHNLQRTNAGCRTG